MVEPLGWFAGQREELPRPTTCSPGLIFFYDTDGDARIVSLDGRYPEVVGGEYLRAKLEAISIG